VSEMTTTRMDEANEWAKELSSGADYYDEKHDTDITLSDKPTVEELKSALDGTRTQVHLALTPLIAEVEAMQKELDKFRNHRHDFSKTFSGRAEF